MCVECSVRVVLACRLLSAAPVSRMCNVYFVIYRMLYLFETGEFCVTTAQNLGATGLGF